MPLYTVAGFDCGRRFTDLLKDRLRKNRVPAAAEAEGEHGVSYLVKKADLPVFSKALSDLLTLDLRCFETARLVSLLPLDIRDRRLVLPRALALSFEEKPFDASRRIEEYLCENSLFIAEGFLRFRLPEVMEAWAAAVDRAGEELLLGREYASLMQLLAAVAEAETGTGCSRSVRLILHADGSATVSDPVSCRIESAGADGAGIMGILIGLAPDEIEVYDLTGGAHAGLLEAIRRVFGKRARIFVSNNCR